jgi:ATP-dependent RNA circularization protein (DNA/RNA ligase family)
MDTNTEQQKSFEQMGKDLGRELAKPFLEELEKLKAENAKLAASNFEFRKAAKNSYKTINSLLNRIAYSDKKLNIDLEEDKKLYIRIIDIQIVNEKIINQA